MPHRGPHRPLSPRQRDICVGIFDGLSYAEIGERLGISPHTVAAHVRMIAMLFDGEGEFGRLLAPRQIIYLWMMYEHWESKREAPSKTA